jgi:hypothetical protein
MFTSPNSDRPWQQVFEYLNGYLVRVGAIIREKPSGTWNFVPNDFQLWTVANVSDFTATAWGIEKLGTRPF